MALDQNPIGLYLGLFAVASTLLISRKSFANLPSKTFLAGIVSMFLLISLHYAISAYRITVAFASWSDTQQPVLNLYDMTRWENLSRVAIEAIVLWIGDALAIYRCFLVWKRSYWAIALPLLLFIWSVATHMMGLWMVGQQQQIQFFGVAASPILSMVFPLCLVQNILTTFLVIFKIWSQHTQAKSVGLVSLNSPQLVTFIRIIIESAAIYTAALLVLVILRAIDHPGRFFVHTTMPPLTGIMFVLLTVRTHIMREEAKDTVVSASLLPSWLFRGPHELSRCPTRNSERPGSNTAPVLIEGFPQE
ncbi:hypothetical protein BKA70DRAFT_1451219 [Coprinopsis sp. MPI-PUGE-AT-0042]|nr:hypothetical protein BKA70DRAFT_1451219 [Coprinopsis sp. MPI-PUGE-AT-0042]